ncbi:MAG: hypothetical protein K5745_00955 [Saccharofermentans sp.]|nr:hypothetical protein [Saccharofermentans sp.]
MNWKYSKAMLFGFMCVFGCVLVGVLINTQALRLDGKGSMGKDVDASATAVKGDCLNTPAEAAHTQILTVVAENLSPFYWGEPVSTSFVIYEDNTLEIENFFNWDLAMSYTGSIKPADFQKINSLCNRAIANEPWEGMDYSGTCDGSVYYFSYYGSNFYGGYIYGIDVLEELMDILREYNELPDSTELGFTVFEGLYVCPEDSEQYVELYKSNGGQIYLKMTSSAEGKKQIKIVHVTDIVFDGYNIYYSDLRTWDGDRATFSLSQDKTTITGENGISYVMQN